MAQIFASERGSATRSSSASKAAEPARATAPEAPLERLQMQADQSPAAQRLTQLQDAATAQRMDDEEALQGKGLPAQLPVQMMDDEDALQGKGLNPNGLPSGMQQGMEQASGTDLSDVQVHYNSPQPAALQAHAFAQGTDIHLGPGQEQHLGHEAWHTVQQKQGQVQPTTEVAGTPVNDSPGLEREADQMGSKFT